MTYRQADRRVTRSKVQLQKALNNLMIEKPFDQITVQEIIERANVGRSTFYAHFHSKEDLFLSGHDGVAALIINSIFEDDGTLRLQPSQEWVAFLERIHQQRDAYFFLTRGSGTAEIHRRFQERVAAQFAARLHQHFKEENSTVTFEVLGLHVAVSMTSLLHWWTAKRNAYSAQEMAAMMHKMNIAALQMAMRM